jgi:predicted dehydrogenase
VRAGRCPEGHDGAVQDRLRVGVVGLGIGKAHVDAYLKLPDAYEVVALCDANPRRTARLSEAWAQRWPDEAPRQLTSVDELCELGLDVVSVCTPPFLHFSQVSQLLAAGSHVVCEKPLVGSVAEVDELAELEAEHGTRVVPIFQYRYGRGLQRLRALRQAGLCGRAYTTTVEVAWRRGPDYYAVPWRGRLETELGGVLLSHCVHGLDMVTSLLGPATDVFARTAVRVNDVETEDCASASITLGDGSFLTLSATLGSAEEISRHRFCFEHLTAESNLEPYTNSSDPWTFTATTPEQQQAVDEALAAFRPRAEGYERQLELVAGALAAGDDPPVTLADARHSLELVTGLYDSARSGRSVSLPIDEGHRYYGGWR